MYQSFSITNDDNIHNTSERCLDALNLLLSFWSMETTEHLIVLNAGKA
jgi:hypothetical protein